MRLRMFRPGQYGIGRALAIAGVAVGVMTAAACHTDAVFKPEPQSASLFWTVRLNQHAARLNLNGPDTLRLIATPYTAFGDTWTPQSDADTTTISWISSDSSKVRVSSDGLLTARNLTSTVRIIMRQTVRNVTRADTCQVQVVQESPRTLSRIIFYPDTASGDSVNVAAGQTKYGVKLTALDASNAVMSGVIGYITSSDTTIAKPGSPWTSGGTAYIVGQRVGTALMTATTFVYGVQQTDTFRVHVGYPITATAAVIGRVQFDGTFGWYTNGFDSTEVGPGATILFENDSRLSGAPGGPIDVTFDNPSAALPAPYNTPTGSGNITALPADTGYTGQSARQQYRMFAAPGTYTFHVPQYHFDGALVVKPTP